MNVEINRPPSASNTDPMEVVIVRLSDGAHRVFHRPEGWIWEGAEWWAETHAGCDCSLRKFWARSADPPESEEGLKDECGEIEFRVILR